MFQLVVVFAQTKKMLVNIFIPSDLVANNEFLNLVWLRTFATSLEIFPQIMKEVEYVLVQVEATNKFLWLNST